MPEIFKRIFRRTRPAKPCRIVIDTNIMVAAMMKPTTASRKILDMCVEGRLSLLVTRQIRREYLTILSQRWVKSDWVKQFDGRITESAEMVVPEKRLYVIEEDPSDNRFLECAMTGKAYYLITSDRHLLILKRFHQTEIITPTQFLKCLTS